MKYRIKSGMGLPTVLLLSAFCLALLIQGSTGRAAAVSEPLMVQNEAVGWGDSGMGLYLPLDFGLTDAQKPDGAAAGAIPCSFPLPGGMCPYYGDLHSHTSYSDGQATPLVAFETARANGMDFFGITDHAFMLDDNEWADIKAQAQAASVIDEFVAFGGFEWSSATDGHIGVINSEDLAQATDPEYDSLDEFYSWILEPDQLNSLVRFNHPLHPAEAFRSLEYQPLVDPRINFIEIHDGATLRKNIYDMGLAAGWHVAPANNSDTHLANWGKRPGRNGVLATGLTRYQIINALRARRTFVTQDENLMLALRADGYWMGSVLPTAPTHFDVYAFDLDPDDTFKTLELFQNGEVVKSVQASGNSYTWRVALSPPYPPGTWWYVKATQNDRSEAYTSPIWTRQPKNYDVMIRDNMWDVGDVPSFDPSWQSPDIWIRRTADGQIWHENPIAGDTNYVHARLHNNGLKTLSDLDVYFYWSSPTLGPAWPSSWNPINSTPVRVQSLAPGGMTAVRTPWSVPVTVPDQAGLLVRVVSSQDPIRYDDNPKWDNNIAWKNIQILDGTPPSGDLVFSLTNPFGEAKTAELHLSSREFPAQGSLTLRLQPNLFDRWMATAMGGVVKGAIVNRAAKTIAITDPMEAAVYGLPMLSQEDSPTTLTFDAPVDSTLSVQVSEQVEDEEIGGNLYTTPYSRTPRKIELQATASSLLVSRTLEITALVVGDGFVPIPDGTPVRITSTLGELSTGSSQTENGMVRFSLNAGTSTGTAVVQAAVPGVVTGTTEIDIYRTCWVRLNNRSTDFFAVQAAVNASNKSTDVVKVAGHCSLPNSLGGLTQVAFINKTLTVRGGYTTTQWTTSDPVANPTTLDAEGRGRVLYITGNNNPTIENMRITGGDATGLGGGPGGADAGGGVFAAEAVPTIKGTWLSGNTAAAGAAIYLSQSDATLVNSVIADNEAADGTGGLYVVASSPQLRHNTIARNGIGVWVTNSGSNFSAVDMTNTILVGHDIGLSVAAGNTANLEATLWGTGDWGNDTDWTGAGGVDIGTTNIYGDPAFTCLGRRLTCTPGTLNVDFHIGADSAALDAGVNAGVGDDIDGDPRFDGRPDIGADELLAALAVTKFAMPAPAKAGGETVYTIQITNTGDTDLHASVVDRLPMHILPGETNDGQPIVSGGTLSWNPTIAKPQGSWVQTFTVVVENDYVGTLTNQVEVTTEESASGSHTETTETYIEKLRYLPNLMLNELKCAPKLLSEIAVGPAPRQVALDTAGRRAFVAHVDGITVIDIDNQAVLNTTYYPDAAHGIAYDPDRDRIWVTDILADRVLVLDGGTYAVVANLPTGDRPHSVAYNPANGRVYVTNYQGWTVSVYDAEALTHVAELTDFAEPAHLAVNSLTNRIYVANHRVNNHVTVIDGTNHKTRRIPTGLIDAYGIAVDPTRNLVYATAIAHARISIIDGATEKQLGVMEMRRSDGELAPLRVITVNPDMGPEGHLLVVTSREDGGRDQLLLIPNGWPSLGTPVPLNIASYPLEGIALDPVKDRAWVTSVQSGLVGVVQDSERLCVVPFYAQGQDALTYQLEWLGRP